MDHEHASSILCPADTVLINGNVLTIDRKFSLAQAVALKDNIILAAGSNDEIRQLTGSQTKILDLKGATLLPGFNDTHCHISDWALTRPPFVLDVRFPEVKSIADIQKSVAARAGEVKQGEWIQGEGWDEGYLAECRADAARKPSKEDLDKAAPENPVSLGEYSGHRRWLNSLGLKLCGITAATPDPVGGKIERNPETGEPTGLLYEKASFQAKSAIPDWTISQRKEALMHAMAELSSLGITSYTDAVVDRAKWAIYNDAFNDFFKAGKWSCRVNMLLLLGSNEQSTLEGAKQALKYVGARHNFGNDWLRINGAKIIADGIPPLKTGWMYDDYEGGGKGGLVVEGESPEEQEENLRELISILHENRYQVAIHSTGDRTTDVCMDQFMKCIEKDPWDARHYTIHSDFARPETIRKVSEFGRRTGFELGMNVQSSIKWTISGFMESVVGAAREAYHWPLRTMLDNGIHVADSSDAPVTYPDWRAGIRGAVLRESKATGKVSGPEQRITVQEAIRNYTWNGAWFDHQEDIKGSIESGKLADLCLVDQDILNIDPHKITELKVLMTIAGGKIVYDNGATGSKQDI